MRRVLLVAALMTVTLTAASRSVEPDEMLADPALETRAREISAELRCLVCQNQSIDDSNAELAHDLRILVRERLVAGDSDEAVIDYVVARYGEFVLLKPPFDVRTLLLWLAAPALLAAGGAALIVAIRRRRPPTPPLSDQERAEIARLLDDNGRS